MEKVLCCMELGQWFLFSAWCNHAGGGVTQKIIDSMKYAGTITDGREKYTILTLLMI